MKNYPTPEDEAFEEIERRQKLTGSRPSTVIVDDIKQPSIPELQARIKDLEEELELTKSLASDYRILFQENTLLRSRLQEYFKSDSTTLILGKNMSWEELYQQLRTTDKLGREYQKNWVKELIITPMTFENPLTARIRVAQITIEFKE